MSKRAYPSDEQLGAFLKEKRQRAYEQQTSAHTEKDPVLFSIPEDWYGRQPNYGSCPDPDITFPLPGVALTITPFARTCYQKDNNVPTELVLKVQALMPSGGEFEIKISVSRDLIADNKRVNSLLCPVIERFSRQVEAYEAGMVKAFAQL